MKIEATGSRRPLILELAIKINKGENLSPLEDAFKAAHGVITNDNGIEINAALKNQALIHQAQERSAAALKDFMAIKAGNIPANLPKPALYSGYAAYPTDADLFSGDANMRSNMVVLFAELDKAKQDELAPQIENALKTEQKPSKGFTQKEADMVYDAFVRIARGNEKASDFAVNRNYELDARFTLPNCTDRRTQSPLWMSGRDY